MYRRNQGQAFSRTECLRYTIKELDIARMRVRLESTYVHTAFL